MCEQMCRRDLNTIRCSARFDKQFMYNLVLFIERGHAAWQIESTHQYPLTKLRRSASVPRGHSLHGNEVALCKEHLRIVNESLTTLHRNPVVSTTIRRFVHPGPTTSNRSCILDCDMRPGQIDVGSLSHHPSPVSRSHTCLLAAKIASATTLQWYYCIV